MVDNTIEDQQMPLLDHLIELRRRLLYSVLALFVMFIICFVFSRHLYAFLAQPLIDIMADIGRPPEEQRMIFTDLIEPFFTYVKVSFFFAAFITCPVFLSQIWAFVAPGLYKNEKSAFAPFLVASPVLFFIGASLVYYIILPMAWEFFLSFENSGADGGVKIQLEAKVNEYLALTMKLIFAFGICFQLPVVMTLMARAGMATSKGMAEKRKYAIVGVFVIAAIFTPPDPLSQLSLAIPIILLYEISIQLAKLAEKKALERQQEIEEELSS